jgi:hypothetical protein
MEAREGLSAYMIYIAMKMHFNSNYDYIKYNGKTKINAESFLKRKDKFFFRKLSKKYSKDELKDFFISTFVANDKKWVGNMVSEEAEHTYAEWKKTQESLTYVFEQDIRTLNDTSDNFNSLFDLSDGHPKILKLLMQKKIKLETIVILDILLNFTTVFDKHLDDIIWEEHGKLIKKYKVFLSIDRKKYMSILKKQFT